MAKGTIVVDIPKDCWSCDYIDSQWCALTSKNVYNGNAQKHCPIKELPRELEKDEISLGRVSRYAKFEDGWNAYRNKILGE